MLNTNGLNGLSPADKSRAVEILKALELTEWQRWWRGLVAAHRKYVDECERTKTQLYSYHDALEAARLRNKLGLKDPENPTLADFAGGLKIDAMLRAKPDEVARRARIDGERDERQAAMMSAYKASRPAEQVAGSPEVPQPKQRIRVELE